MATQQQNINMTIELEKMTIQQLKQLCRDNKYKGFSLQKKKADLILFIKNKQQENQNEVQEAKVPEAPEVQEAKAPEVQEVPEAKVPEVPETKEEPKCNYIMSGEREGQLCGNEIYRGTFCSRHTYFAIKTTDIKEVPEVPEVPETKEVPQEVPETYEPTINFLNYKSDDCKGLIDDYLHHDRLCNITFLVNKQKLKRKYSAILTGRRIKYILSYTYFNPKFINKKNTEIEFTKWCACRDNDDGAETRNIIGEHSYSAYKNPLGDCFIIYY